MADDITYAYAADIVKSVPNDDGTLTVYGKAAGSDLDMDEQRCDPAWLKSATADWFSRWGNIREGHDAKRAIGVATELESHDNADQWITAKVVDPLAITKINEKVLKGFSIGIKAPRVRRDPAAPGGVIYGGTIVETSIVDNACNQTCKFVVAKSAGADVVADQWEDDGTDDVDIAKAARGHSHAHQHEDGNHSHSHTHDPGGSYDHGDGEPHGHAHDSSHPARMDGGMARKAADAAPSVSKEDDMPMTLPALMEMLKAATPEDRAAVAALFTPPAPPESAADKSTKIDDKKIEDDDETTAPAVLDAESIKTAITEAVKAALVEPIKGFEDQVAELKKMAAPGGPVRSVTAPADVAKSAEANKAATAAYYRHQAEVVTDPAMAQAYRAKAAALTS